MELAVLLLQRCRGLADQNPTLANLNHCCCSCCCWCCPRTWSNRVNQPHWHPGAKAKVPDKSGSCGRCSIRSGICRGQSEAQPATFGLTRCPRTGPAMIEGFWAACPGGSRGLPAANAWPLAYLAIIEANRAVKVNGVLTSSPQESVNAAGYYDGCSLIANGRSCGIVAVYRAYFAQVTNGPPGSWYTLVVQGNITYSLVGRNASVKCPLDPAQANVIWVRK